MLPAGSFKGTEIAKGAFSFCLACKTSPIKCSIWYAGCRAAYLCNIFSCYLQMIPCYLLAVFLCALFFSSAPSVITVAIKHAIDSSTCRAR